MGAIPLAGIDFHILLALTRDSVMVLTWDGTIALWNRAAEERYGWKREEALGKNAHELLQTEFPVPVDELKEIVENAGQWEGELIHTRRDGAKLVASSCWVRQDGGERPWLIEVNTDITERRRGEDALRHSEARLSAIIDSAMDAIISVNKDQNIVLFNSAAEKIFRCKAAEVLGKSLDMFIPVEFREAHRQYIRDFGQTGATKRSMTSPAILTGRRADGEVFPIEATVSQVRVNGERVFTVILRDISERVRAEEEARKQAETIHQLSTPVLTLQPGLLVVPLIGNIDAARAAQLTQQVLDGIRSQRARAVVIDITGVASLDTYVANHLMKTVKACELLGAQVVLTGISKQTAQTLVSLGIDWGQLNTTSSLENGLERAKALLSSRRSPRVA